jgi:hypothetical protein
VQFFAPPDAQSGGERSNKAPPVPKPGGGYFCCFVATLAALFDFSDLISK